MEEAGTEECCGCRSIRCWPARGECRALGIVVSIFFALGVRTRFEDRGAWEVERGLKQREAGSGKGQAWESDVGSVERG